MTDQDQRIGCFRVLKDLMLGTGGQGTVYRAVCEREVFEGLAPGTEVALKVMTVSGDSDEQYARLERRMTELVNIDNPRIVRYFGCFRERGPFSDLHVIVLEFLEGETLKDLLHRRPRGLGSSKALHVARQMAEGLEHLSTLGIVHRDIKPGNIFLCRDGGVKLIDFGVARQDDASHTASTAHMVGTCDYMAPDFIDSTFRGDERSDIFSFGVCLHEMFTGRQPYRSIASETAQSDFLFLSRWHGDANVDPIRISPDVTLNNPALDRMLRRMLERKRTARYESFREIILDLWGLGSDSTVSSPSMLPSQEQANERRPGLSNVIKTGCVLVAATLALAGVWNFRASIDRWMSETRECVLSRFSLLPAPEPQDVSDTDQPTNVQATNVLPTNVLPTNVQATDVAALPPASAPSPVTRPAPPDETKKKQDQEQARQLQDRRKQEEALHAAERAIAQIKRTDDILFAERLSSSWTQEWNDGRVRPDFFKQLTGRIADACNDCRIRAWTAEAGILADQVTNAYLFAERVDEGDSRRDAWLLSWAKRLPQAFVDRCTNDFATTRALCEHRANAELALREADSITNDFYRIGNVTMGDVKRRSWLSRWRPEDLRPGLWEACRRGFEQSRIVAERLSMSANEYASVTNAEQEAQIVVNFYQNARTLAEGDEKRNAWTKKWISRNLPNQTCLKCTARIENARKERRQRIVNGKVANLTEKFETECRRLEKLIEAAERPGAIEDPTILWLQLHQQKKEYIQKVQTLRNSVR